MFSYPLSPQEIEARGVLTNLRMLGLITDDQDYDVTLLSSSMCDIAPRILRHGNARIAIAYVRIGHDIFVACAADGTYMIIKPLNNMEGTDGKDSVRKP